MKTKFHECAAYAAAAAVFSVIIFFYSESVAPMEYLGVPTYAEQVVYSGGPETSAQAFALADVYSGEILHSRNADTRLPMASTTKIMTAVVILENMNIEAEVKIPHEAVGTEGSSIYLADGEVLTVNELLYGLMLESGNDAAEALAIACAGSIEKFADMMNQKARELELTDTHFDNPHGLSSETHYTTAGELAQIAAYAMRNGEFRKIVATEKYIIPERENCRARYFSNHNKLLCRLDICDGVKTGYTAASGRCLVTSADAGEGRFVAVTLNDRNDWNDHKAMLTFATENYKSVKVASAGELKYSFTTTGFPKYDIAVENAHDIYVTLPKNYDGNALIQAEIYPRSNVVGSLAGNVFVKAGELEKSFELVITSCTDAGIGT